MSRIVSTAKRTPPLIVGGRYGLSSKDTTPAQIVEVYDNLKLAEPKNHFTVGIVDDVTFLSLPVDSEINVGGEGMFRAKFYGLGADGTVGANKNSVKIIGDNTDKYCQAYFIRLQEIRRFHLFAPPFRRHADPLHLSCEYT